ncbi:CASP-like protein 5B2 isoform X2 [Helianthus annuus]|uniref:CASP-like protein 5B2 isoform X2 n=1 Tax=Helianthus annuus TaxID=4232 RepID=UPI001652C94B|nr:CASP-like protein 5B2 isoform X2 [Helianthus annuus]
MKDMFGSPGSVSGLMLRIGQCLCAAASIGWMVSASGFSSYTAFCYLIASMGLQVLWSFGLACLDVYALRIKKDLQNAVLVSLFVVGDWERVTCSIQNQFNVFTLKRKGTKRLCGSHSFYLILVLY